MNWQEIISHEFLWLGLALIGLAFSLGMIELYNNLFGDNEDDE